jgi:hypothetical protein
MSSVRFWVASSRAGMVVSHQIRRYRHCEDRTFEIVKKISWICSPFDTLVVDGLPIDDQRHLLADPLRQWEIGLPQPACEALSGSD